MASKKFLATTMSAPQWESSIQTETESYCQCFQKEHPQKLLPRECTSTFCVWNVFYIDWDPRNLKVSRQFSKPSPCFTIHRHHGNKSRGERPRKELMIFSEKILCVKVFKKQICLFQRALPNMTAKLDGFQEISGHQNVNPAVGKFNSNWNWIIPSMFSKQRTPTEAVPPWICIDILGMEFVLHWFGSRNLKALRQFSKPSPWFTNHRRQDAHSRRECPRKQLFVFSKSNCCVKVFKKQFFTWQPNLMASKKISGHQNVNSVVGTFNSNWNWIVPSQFSKQRTPTEAAPLWMWIGNLCMEYVLHWFGSKEPQCVMTVLQTQPVFHDSQTSRQPSS